MRRKDREVTDIADILGIIQKCDVCRLALAEDNVPYVVPMNFGYEYENGALTLYFHGAGEGKKHDIIKNNPRACFEMDCSHRLIEASEAQHYTMEYESVVGNGHIAVCEEADEKIKALRLLMRQYARDKEFEFPAHVVGGVTVLRLDVTDFTGKRLKKI